MIKSKERVVLGAFIGLWLFLLLFLAYDFTCSSIVVEGKDELGSRFDWVSYVIYSSYLTILTVMFHYCVPRSKRIVIEQIAENKKIIRFSTILMIVIPILYYIRSFFPPPFCENFILPLDLCFLIYILFFPFCFFWSQEVFLFKRKKLTECKKIIWYVAISWFHFGIILFPAMAARKKRYDVFVLWILFVYSMALIDLKMAALSS